MSSEIFSYKFLTQKEGFTQEYETEAISRLNTLGDQGWEMVSCLVLDEQEVDAVPYKTFRYIFKRRLR